LFPNHLELAVNDQYAPAAAFLGSAQVDPNPSHVTYVVDTARDRPNLGLVADHAYWMSGVTIRSASHTSYTGDPEGQIDAVSHGFGHGDPLQLAPSAGPGTLTGGNLGTLLYAGTSRSWGAAPPALTLDAIDVNATNIATATIDPGRAHVDCHAILNITTDGPIALTLAGCGRTVHAG
jgi:hypothetical protein